jgi:hypothetical protein
MQVSHVQEQMTQTVNTEMSDETLLSSFSALPPALAERVNKQPEYRLLWAVLQRGVGEYMKNVFATSRRGQRLYQEAEAWIQRDDETWLCSFVNICHVLGLDPDALRAGVKRWRAEQESPAVQQAA